MKTRPNIQVPTKIHQAILQATAGRLVRPRRRTDAYLDLVERSQLPGTLAYMYANAITAGTMWNAFHRRMVDHDVIPCAPYAVAISGARHCDRPAVCPSCSARQTTRLVETLQANQTRHIAVARLLSRGMDTAAVTQMCTLGRQLLARARAKTSALLLRVYPRSDEDVPVIGAILVSGDGNPDVFMDGAFGLDPRTFDVSKGELVDFVNTYAGYPARLMSLDPAAVWKAYALLRGFRSSISRKKANAKFAYYQWDGHSGRLASDFPDLENAAGDTGGLVSEPCGRSELLHPAPVVATAGR